MYRVIEENHSDGHKLILQLSYVTSHMVYPEIRWLTITNRVTTVERRLRTRGRLYETPMAYRVATSLVLNSAIYAVNNSTYVSSIKYYTLWRITRDSIDKI